MGMLRLFLAVAVVLTHVQATFQHTSSFRFGYQGLDAATAVEIFFVISGFYMALILEKKYTGSGSEITFYVNRLTRIYPVYWSIVGGWLMLEIIRYAATGHAEVLLPWLKHAPLFRWDTWTFLVGINFGIIGQDLALFLHFTSTDGSMAWGASNTHAQMPVGLPDVWQFCLDTPAWSIALELMFYALAPFLVRRKIWIIASIAAGSFLFKLWLLFGLKLNHDPFTYRLFPAELCLFLSGVLAYRCRSWLRLREWKSHWLTVAIGFYLLMMLSPCLPRIYESVRLQYLGAGLILISILMLPVLFHGFGRVAWDRALGDLSYPVYLVHKLVLGPIIGVALSLHLSPMQSAWVAVAGSIAIAYFLNRFLIDPIEQWRADFYLRRKAKAKTEALSSEGEASVRPTLPEPAD